MNILKLSLAGLLFAVSGAFAQTPADPAQKEAVRELLDAMNFKQVMGQMATGMTANMPKMMEQTVDGMLDGLTDAKGRKLSAPDQADVRKTALGAMQSMGASMADLYNDPEIVGGMEDVMARMYAKYFTLDEIRATTAFYRSPAGRKALTVMPAMMQEAMPQILSVMQPRLRAISEKMMREVSEKARETAKAKGGN